MSSQAKTYLPLLVLLFNLSAMTSATSSPYVVEDFTLGQRIPLGDASYRSYTCAPSNEFEGFTWCQRTEPRRTSLGNGIFSRTIMHAEDGTAIYLMANLAPVSLDRNAVQTEIERLSRQMNERPAKIEWLPQRPGLPTSVIALWGKIELQKLNPYETETVAAGESPRRGVLVDSLGDLARSAKAGLPVYRIAGGAGYLYSASFDASGRGHRHYLAADISQPAIKKFEPELHDILQKDQARPSNDYELWREVASLTRTLSLETSPRIANEALDKVFDEYPSKKLRSHVWSLLPLGSHYDLKERVHSTFNIYGPKTKYPEIRLNIQRFLADKPAEPFSEFLYYTLGEFDKALQTNQNSIIRSVVSYAAGHKILESLLQDTRKVVPVRVSDREPVNDTLMALNQNAGLYENKLLGSVVPNFAARAAVAKPYFEAVLRDQSSPLRDDAAYMLGWLAFHQGKIKEALDYTSQALTSGNGDYAPAATRQIARVLIRFPVSERIALIESNPVLAQGLANPVLTQDPALLWYVAARGAYREFNYTLAIEIAEKGLIAMKVPLDRLPATTNPALIREALEKIDVPDGLGVGEDVIEVLYLIEASREILDYEKYLKTVATNRFDNVAKRARAIILKYSLLIDGSEKAAQHKDLRQAVHLIDMTLESVPKNSQYATLREWLYYRKVRNLAQFNPIAVPGAVAAMEREFPRSQLMDDALAEQIYAEGARMEDIDAARRTFEKLVTNFPMGNAVDNAYTWMAISYQCAGRSEDAQRMNREIIRRFPTTRHADYARERLSHPEARDCTLSIFSFSDERRRLRP